MEKLILRELPEDVSQLPVDMANPNRTLFHGCFTEKTTVCGEERTFCTYIPDGLEYCSPCLVVAPPSGCTLPDYIDESGLREFADEQRLYLFVLVPREGGWRLDGTDADFMNAVYAAAQQRNYYVTMQDNFYACGIGDGVSAAHQAAQRMTSEWSGLFSFGPLKCDLRETADVMAESRQQNGAELRIAASKCQLPVWIAAESRDELTDAAVEYWRGENSVTDSPLSGEGADFIWMPAPVRRRSEVNEERIAQVRLTLGSSEVSADSLRRMWSYIGLARRHRGFGGKHLRCFKSPEAMGAELRSMEAGGMRRIWYEYVPKCCTPGRSWPLVVVMHGRGGSAETFFDLSDMFHVAEERKFIAVFPQGGIHQQKQGGLKNVLYWNGSIDGKPIDDVAFIRAMVEDIAGRLPVDRGRVYACGQSSGGIMTDVLSTSASDIFTACASWSGMYHPKKVHGRYERTEPVIPTMFICGAEDPFCTESGDDPDFPFRLIPELRRDLLEKIERCGLDIKRMQTWRTYPITWHCWPNADGVPMLTVGIVSGMAHANYPEESWISYDQFFSSFARDDGGVLRYRGQIVR